MAESCKVTDLLPAENLNAVKVDWHKVGMALVVARLLTTQSLAALGDKDWYMSSLLTLLGFTAYNLVTARLVDSGKFADGRLKAALDDVLKVGTMLVVSRLLAGGSLNDAAWQKASALTLVGFVAYDLGSFRVTDVVAANCANNVKAAVEDTVKFGTMYAVSRYLSGQEFTREYLMESGAFIAGLVSYDLLFVQ